MGKATRSGRRWLPVIALVGGLTALTAAPLAAQISVVIAASSSHTPDPAEIADIFAGVRFTWGNGTLVQVVDQPDTPAGARFYADFLEQPLPRVRRRWARGVLSGQALPPARLETSAAVKQDVARNPNAIGYIPTSQLDDTVREVHRIN